MQLTVKYTKVKNDSLEIQVSYRKKVMFDSSIVLAGKSHEEIKQEKESLLKKFCLQYPKIEQKDVLLAFSKADTDYLALYKKLYPHGGYRGGGRPKGRRTDKTERFLQAITKEEKEYLTKCLEEYRQKYS